MATKQEKENFIAKFTPYLLKKSNENGIPFAFTISHIAMESGFGTKAPGFNFFGIKAPEGEGQLLWTWEAYYNVKDFDRYQYKKPETLKFENGKYKMMVKRWFKKFDSKEQGIDFYYKLLLNSRYKPALDNFNKTGSVWGYALEIMKRGYATTNSENYANRIKNLFYDDIKPVLDSNKDLNPTNIVFPFILVLGILFVYFMK